MTLTRRDLLRSALTVPSGLALGGCSLGDDAAFGFGSDKEAVAAAGSELPAPGALLHLLKRTRFGISRADYDHAASVGAAAYLDEQLAPEMLPDAIEAEADRRWPLLTLPPAALYRAYNEDRARAASDLSARTLFLASWSERQLYELMVDFWTNHFNVPNVSGRLPMYKAVEDRTVMRAHALGRFADLLAGSAKSPAMVMYLGSATNGKDRPNENYARELMELHTIATEFSEPDVREVARCFTGWTIDESTHEFAFDAERHDAGEKRVLGRTIAAGGGVEDGEAVLAILAAHPLTARHIARKLARRFVADAPPEAVVAAVAQAFEGSGGDVPSLLRVLFAHADFAASADARTHRPLEFVCAATRALAPAPADYHGPDPIAALARMGQVPHQWIPPDGFPDTSDYWLSVSGIAERWNFAALLCESRDVQPGHAQKLLDDPEAPTTVVDKLAAALLHRPLRSDDRAALIAWIGGDPGRSLTGNALRAAAESVAGALLASPYFQVR